ncbi:hypothetical protein C1645_744597 [Glomus cerebriforme]|uniref:Uncharacterized protein n=1 Tax=Glomus cerebriforme TaxID=658196 RepID=A0A397S4L3_9GLOM|nr:hypothetical protein C1645_744597 [Glomus cerebriforme]
MSGSETDVPKLDILEICHKLPPTTDLIKFLKEKEKKIPAMVNIFAIPSNLSKSEEEDKKDLELLSLFISLLSSVQIYNGRPSSEWPDISKPEEVVDYMKLKSQTFFELITRRKLFAMILPEKSHASDHFEDTSTTVDIHISILEKLFKSFRFPSAKLRVFYLTIDNESWSIFIEKASSKQEKFVMDYFDFVFTFNKTAMNNNRDFINETIDKITGDARKEIEDILKPEYVNPAADVIVEEDK